MKTTIISRIILIFCLLFFLSCSKNSDSIVDRGKIQAKFDGILKVFDDNISVFKSTYAGF